jgi:hypothetical protein
MPNQEDFDPMSIVGVKPTASAKKAFDPMSIVGVAPQKKNPIQSVSSRNMASSGETDSSDGEDSPWTAPFRGLYGGAKAIYGKAVDFFEGSLRNVAASGYNPSTFVPTVTVREAPKEGDINSHTYLVQKSGDYIGTTGLNDDIQVLLDEISSLQQIIKENEILQSEILELNAELHSTTKIYKACREYSDQVYNKYVSKVTDNEKLNNKLIKYEDEQELIRTQIKQLVTQLNKLDDGLLKNHLL